MAMSVAAQSPFPAHSSKRRFEPDSPDFTGSPSACGGGKRLRQLSGSPRLDSASQAYAVRPGLVCTLLSLFPDMDEKVQHQSLRLQAPDSKPFCVTSGTDSSLHLLPSLPLVWP